MRIEDFNAAARHEQWQKIQRQIAEVDHPGINAVRAFNGEASQGALVLLGKRSRKQVVPHVVAEFDVRFPVYDSSMRFDVFDLALKYLEASKNKVEWDVASISSGETLTKATVPIVILETPMIARYAERGWATSLKNIRQMPKERHLDELYKALLGNLSVVEMTL